MLIQQQRIERGHLQQLVERSALGATASEIEKETIVGLWRTAEHHATNSRIERPESVQLITSGWAGWLRCTDDGRRLILLFLIPGDFVVPGLMGVPNCEVTSLTPVRTVDASALLHDRIANPCAAASIEGSGLRYRHLLLDHMTRLMLGSTTSSIAHLLIEFHERSLRCGASIDGRFSIPIGQRLLAQAIGRSTVQVNKVIHKFQDEGLISVGYDWIRINDFCALRKRAGVANTRESIQSGHEMADHELARVS